jgi:type IV pilus assembly protein PilB
MAFKDLEPSVRNVIENHPTMKGKGCSHCQNTGYAGRIAIHEVLKISNRIQAAINNNKSENDIFTIAKEEGFETMAKVALNKIISGELSIAEYLRVIPKGDETINL